MSKSQVTKDYTKKAVIFTILSWVIVWLIAVGFVIYGFCTTWGSDNVELKDKLGSVIYGIGVSLIPIAVLAIIAKNRVKPVVWMINIILAAYLFNDVVMFIVFFVWIIDTYIISLLAQHYRNKASINKEIDKRK